MAVTASNATSSIYGVRETSGQSETASSDSHVDMDGFLTMFMTQLKHQDPTNPLESYELSAQLAQFSSVEKLSQINTNILKATDYLASISYGQMAQMIGKEVVGVDNSLVLHEGEISKSSYTMDVAADVTIKIYNENGSLVRTMSLGSQDSGTYDVQWDGLDDSGKAVSDGTYYVQVEAVDAEGNSVDATQTVSGKVYAFCMEQNNPHLVIGGENGVKLTLGSITEVRNAEEGEENSA